MKGKLVIGLAFLFASCLGDGPVDPQVEYEKQLAKDVSAIDQYLADNGITSAIKDASGVRIVIETLGTLGLPPNADNDLKINYTGKLLSNGFIFDQGTVYFRLEQYIKGWQIALSMLPEGSIATIYIPSGLAYGKKGSGTIPGNANLVFNVGLEKVTPTTAQVNKLASDLAAINTYLATNETNEIDATYDSGIYYVMTQVGLGAAPSLYSQIKISFKGKLLSDGSEFINEIVMPSATFSSRVVNYTHGLLLGLQLMNEGGKATFYVPSGLAYGTRAFTGVPANSNIIFEIELLEVIN
jgi:FKBP-type peptidyl-prolyl cis-trans isomerase